MGGFYVSHLLAGSCCFQGDHGSPKEQTQPCEISTCIKSSATNSANNENWPKCVTWPSPSLNEDTPPWKWGRWGETKYFWTIIQMITDTKTHCCLEHKQHGAEQRLPSYCIVFNAFFQTALVLEEAKDAGHCSCHFPAFFATSISPLCCEWEREMPVGLYVFQWKAGSCCGKSFGYALREPWVEFQFWHISPIWPWKRILLLGLFFSMLTENSNI